MKYAIELLLDSNRGVYIPQNFAQDFDISAFGFTENDPDILCLRDGPNEENEWYWEAWHSVLDKAIHTAKNGDIYTLHHDGDLFAICYEKLTAEEKEALGFDS